MKKKYRTPRPVFSVSYGTDKTEFLFYDKLHRDNGPAVEWKNGTREWWVNNKRHRLDGPAIEYTDGRREWWINGHNITEEVEQWLEENGHTYPFNKQTQVLFKLRFLP